ncbi:brachyurin-like [Bicyclus anynana]|uniref:Brachyurin-like n=1 Tax=Bicyclus anynana TaxID=110368 RepID=A0ABM3LT54_BICAN|nr:brachyurin-like [Bicyclus anynana]
MICLIIGVYKLFSCLVLSYCWISHLIVANKMLMLMLACLVSSAFAVQVSTDYHLDIGIPKATRIKEAEDKIFAGESIGNSRIVGGSIAPIGAHPYLAGLVISFHNHPGQSACGASLLSANRLVTAAHCWDTPTLQAMQFVVVLGSEFLFRGGTRIPTSHVILHPQWTPSNLGSDVAMIYLPQKVAFTSRIQPVYLPSYNLWDTFFGQTATAAGYGLTSDSQVGVSVNSMVSHVSLRVISVPQCQAVFGSVFVQQSTLCTDGSGGVGICGGDSGGPLVIQRFGRPTLIGISSFVASIGCELGFPSAFARVTSFYDFIKQHMT